jgi:hypothetical protein
MSNHARTIIDCMIDFISKDPRFPRMSFLEAVTYFRPLQAQIEDLLGELGREIRADALKTIVD